MNAAVECLFTTVVNTKGTKLPAPWLPPHGRIMEVDEEVSVFGGVEALVARNHNNTNRTQKGLFYCLENEFVQIKKTASVVLFDAVAETTKVLRLNSTTLGTINPCWA